MRIIIEIDGEGTDVTPATVTSDAAPAAERPGPPPEVAAAAAAIGAISGGPAPTAVGPEAERVTSAPVQPASGIEPGLGTDAINAGVAMGAPLEAPVVEIAEELEEG
jgi:hypothetical protein